MMNIHSIDGGSTFKKLDTHSYEKRQEALEILRQACIENKVCAACAASAGMYISALAAENLKDFTEAEFMQLAERVWSDVKRQAASRQVQ